MLNEITKKEFEERYPEVSTYGLEAYSPVYLENGVVLIDKEWNGEFTQSRTKREKKEHTDQCRSQTKWTTTAKFYSGKQLATKKSFRKEEPRQAAALLGFFILY